MSTRNLDSIFHPKSIALIGASPRAGSVGAVMARNLLKGGFSGNITFVNPNHKVIDDTTCYPDVPSLPTRPDLAVICTPATTIPQLIGQLAEQIGRAHV